MRTAVIIPARYASTRLPGKMLLRHTGKYLIQHTYEQARRCRCADEVVIATDDARVMAYIGRSGWNTLRIDGAIPDEDIYDAIDESYHLVVSKIPKSRRPEGWDLSLGD